MLQHVRFKYSQLSQYIEYSTTGICLSELLNADTVNQKYAHCISYSTVNVVHIDFNFSIIVIIECEQHVTDEEQVHLLL